MCPIESNPNLASDKPTSSDLKQKYPAPYEPIQHDPFPGSSRKEGGRPEERSNSSEVKETSSDTNQNFPPPYKPIRHDPFSVSKAKQKEKEEKEQKKAEEETKRELEENEEPKEKQPDVEQSFQMPSYEEKKTSLPDKLKVQPKAVFKKEAEKKPELPKTIFGDKKYIERKEFSRWMTKEDSLRKITNMGRREREGLAQDMLSLSSRSKRFLKKDDVERTIRGIKSGKIKPPSSLGQGRFARERATNVLRSFLNAPKKK